MTAVFGGKELPMSNVRRLAAFAVAAALTGAGCSQEHTTSEPRLPMPYREARSRSAWRSVLAAEPLVRRSPRGGPLEQAAGRCRA
jgi:hypothetical protein